MKQYHVGFIKVINGIKFEITAKYGLGNEYLYHLSINGIKYEDKYTFKSLLTFNEVDKIIKAP